MDKGLGYRPELCCDERDPIPNTSKPPSPA